MLPQESPSIGPGKPLPPSLAGEGTVNSVTDAMRQSRIINSLSGFPLCGCLGVLCVFVVSLRFVPARTIPGSTGRRRRSAQRTQPCVGGLTIRNYLIVKMLRDVY